MVTRDFFQVLKTARAAGECNFENLKNITRAHTSQNALAFIRFPILAYTYLWSRQHATAKTVISLKIQQNIDLLQRVTLKSVDFRVKPLKF